MALVRLTLMFHVEDDTHWRSDVGSEKADTNAMNLGMLATVIGGAAGPDEIPRGAKISVQVDRCWLDIHDPDAPNKYPPPTSLSWVLDHGGNFWCHTHSATAAHLNSVHACVASAVAVEGGMSYADAYQHSAGRSGGVELDLPNLDWISITVGCGIRRANSSTVGMNLALPLSLRPHRIEDKDMGSHGVYFHDVAPGPLVDGPITIRQRPFYVSSLSAWNKDPSLLTILPHADLVGSLMVIPAPCRGQLSAMAEGRTTAYSEQNDTVTCDDLDAAFTHLYSSYRLMDAVQNSITTHWYIKVPLYALNQEGLIDSMGAWVDSINAAFSVHGEPPLAAWANFNEIASLYSDEDTWNS